ncbi:MAG: RagB/SusD family nutrient uptake outer membrane protein [Prolixibacteraceae bacterium]
MKKIILINSVFILLIAGCNDEFMDRTPETSIGTENFFNTEDDLAMYIYGLYDFSGVGNYSNDGYSTTDNAANTGNTELQTMMTGNPTSSTITTGWEWNRLRSINLFLENAGKANVSDEIKNHYIGVARFFRARFYMDMVKRYSDVPWYDHVIQTDNEADLMKARDPRDLVVGKIFEDFQFAADHVMKDQPEGAVDNWVVLSYMARAALYEGTFRKYHSELNLVSTANQYLNLAVGAAGKIMTDGGFSLHNTGHPESDYGSLFTSDDLTPNPEVILPVIYEDNVINSGWWAFMFGNYEVSPSKDLLQAYLMNDGSFYNRQAGYETYPFVKEFENRDPRLKQTYAYPGYVLVNTDTYSQGGGIYIQQLQKNFTGYHQIKGFINDKDATVQNNVDFPVIRYAEILLIYAEAKAELGELDQTDLDQTVNLIRSRAGMPPLTMNPAADPVQQARYPGLEDSTPQWAELLEIRRERRIELALEGYRYDDLMRWRAGKLTEKEPVGLYFPGLGKYDLTGDGIEDIILIGNTESIPAADAKEKNSLGVTLVYYRVGAFGSDASFYLENGTSGYVVAVSDRGTFIDPKYYYRPVPASDVTLNPNLSQIFGWE